MSTESKENTEKTMSFLDHLEELRWRIFKSLGSVIAFMLVAFPFTGVILKFLTMPNDRLPEPATLIFLKPTGMLTVRIEIAIVAGIIASLPVIFYQFWQFVAPGLLPNEKKFVFPSIFLTTFCFVTGSAFAYLVLIPAVLPFLFEMGTESITANININDYMSFILRLIMVAGLIFELPVISLLLSNLGILKPEFMRKYRRYGIVGTFIFAAVVTPPDPMSQILMALPLLVLYEISIFVAMFGYSRKKQRDAKWEEEFGD